MIQISDNDYRWIVRILAVLWIPIMGKGAVVVSSSKGLPFSILENRGETTITAFINKITHRINR